VPDTGDVVGPEPLDALGAGLHAVLAQYRARLGRPPSRTEWEHLLGAALLGLQAAGEPVLHDGLLEEVRLLAHRAAPTPR
jgi:hypothetical protein